MLKKFGNIAVDSIRISK